jgi:hypothetical protein
MREHETLRMRYKASGGPSARSSRSSRGTNKQEEGGARRRASGGARRRVGVVARLGSANHATGGKDGVTGAGKRYFQRVRASSTAAFGGSDHLAVPPNRPPVGPAMCRSPSIGAQGLALIGVALLPSFLMLFAFFAFRRCLTLKHLESHLNIFQHLVQLLEMVKR